MMKKLLIVNFPNGRSITFLQIPISTGYNQFRLSQFNSFPDMFRKVKHRSNILFIFSYMTTSSFQPIAHVVMVDMMQLFVFFFCYIKTVVRFVDGVDSWLSR